MKLNKKAVMDDMFDFTVTVVAAIIILFFMLSLSGAVAKKEGLAVKDIKDFNANQVLLNYLKSSAGEGKTIADLILTGKLDLTELEEYTHKFFSEEDCLLVVLSPLIELPPEAAGARRGSVPGEEKLEERKVFHCPNENIAPAFSKTPHLETKAAELIVSDLKTKIYLEYTRLT